MRKVLIGGILLFYSSLSVKSQLLQQDFSSSTTVSNYVSTTPGNGQFNAIGSTGSGVVVSINQGGGNNKLRFDRSGAANAGSYSRTTGFSPVPAAILYKFDLTVSGNTASQTTAAVWQVGSGFGTGNAAESNANVHSRFSLNITTTNGEFQFRNIATPANSQNFSGTNTITWAINNSGGSLLYLAPDGSVESIADDKWDIWVGNTKAFDEQDAQTATQSLSDIKFVIPNSTNSNVGFILDIDNINIDPINTHYSASSGNLNVLSSWSSNSNGVGGNNPTSFTTANTVYVIQNRAAATTGADWVVSGNNSALVVGDGSSGITFSVAASTTFQLGTGSSMQIKPNAVFDVAAGGIGDFNNKPVKILSNNNGNGSIGQIAGSLNNATNVTIDRYIPAKRAFRLLTSPITTTNFISANWQSGFGASSGIGTHITGSVAGSNGFDATASGNASMFTFNNSTQAWDAVLNTNATNLVNGTGYGILIRGDRTTNLSSNTSTPTNTTLRSVGSLTTGDITFSGTGISNTTNNFSLIGNPYASPVDWNNVILGHSSPASYNNIATSYWIWDPNLSGNNGAYVSWTPTGATTGTRSNVSSNINRHLQPGLAFFIQTIGSSPSLKFMETDKSTTNNVLIFSPPVPKPAMYISLYSKEQADKNGYSMDGTAIVFDKGFSNEAGTEDAVKFENPAENIAIDKKTVLLGLECHAWVNGSDTIQLKTWKLTSSNYVLSFEPADFNSMAGTEMYVIDHYLKTSTRLDILTRQMVPFDITTDAASKAANRFAIVFNNSKKNTVTARPPAETFNVTVCSRKDQFIVNYASPKQAETIVRLMNLNGQLLNQLMPGMQQKGSLVIPSSFLSKGVYIIEVQMGNDRVARKVVRNR